MFFYFSDLEFVRIDEIYYFKKTLNSKERKIEKRQKKNKIKKNVNIQKKRKDMRKEKKRTEKPKK